MLSIKEINLLQAQNEGLKKQNAELQKENAILKEENYNKLIAWEEMQAENDRLKEEIKEVKKYQYQQEYLDKEIEEMQKALKTLAEGLNIRQQTLQEIKKIALLGTNVYKEEKEPNSLSTWKNAQFEKILDFITKAESEG